MLIFNRNHVDVLGLHFSHLYSGYVNASAQSLWFWMPHISYMHYKTTRVQNSLVPSCHANPELYFQVSINAEFPVYLIKTYQ